MLSGISPTQGEMKEIALRTPHSASSVRMTSTMKANLQQMIKKQYPPEYVVLDMTVSMRNFSLELLELEQLALQQVISMFQC